MRSDVDQRIQREVQNAAPQQPIDARLRHAAMTGAIKLRPAALLNQRRDFVHQLQVKPQIRSLSWGICDGVSAAGAAVGFGFSHLMPLTMKRMDDIIKPAKT